MEKMDYREALRELRAKIGEASMPADEQMKGSFEEAVYATVLLAEELVGSQESEWEVGSLAQEMLRYAAPFAGSEESHDSMHRAALRMAEVLYGHPRLKLRLLEMALHHATEKEESLEEQIALLRKNIEAADRGAYDEISESGYLKRDPVEWSARWEEVIDEADRMTYARLEDQPRGMGFCHAFWYERRRVLEEEFGIEWRSPATMNPRVMFD